MYNYDTYVYIGTNIQIHIHKPPYNTSNVEMNYMMFTGRL